MRQLEKSLIKLELKSLAFCRRESKNAARTIQQKSSPLVKDLDPSKWAPEWGWYVRNYRQAGILRNNKSKELRHLNIAYGLLRGVPYREMERTCSSPPDPKLVLFYVDKFSGPEKRYWNYTRVCELLK